MTGISGEYQRDFEALPAVLQALLLAELEAGNRILEVGHSFPAPPAGVYFLLANPVTTRARASGGGIHFYARNSSVYSGEFTDERRFCFLLEAPLPPPEEPDMDAIRERQEVPHPPVVERQRAGRHGAGRATLSDTPVDRFRASMVIDYEKWHDGIGYDLTAIAAAKAEERATLETLLLGRGMQDWRDVEALAALGTPRAERALAEAIHHPEPEIRAAVLRYAPALVSDPQREEAILRGLREARIYRGLSATLSLVEAYHPPAVRAAVLRGALEREGEVAVHLAAMAAYLYGKAESPFDWQQRGRFLRFRDEEPAARRAAYLELCDWLGVSGEAAF